MVDSTPRDGWRRASRIAAAADGCRIDERSDRGRGDREDEGRDSSRRQVCGDRAGHLLAAGNTARGQHAQGEARRHGVHDRGLRRRRGRPFVHHREGVARGRPHHEARRRRQLGHLELRCIDRRGNRGRASLRGWAARVGTSTHRCRVDGLSAGVRNDGNDEHRGGAGRETRWDGAGDLLSARGTIGRKSAEGEVARHGIGDGCRQSSSAWFPG